MDDEKGALPKDESITWETNISLLTNPLVLKQMALVVFGSGLFMAFLLSFINLPYSWPTQACPIWYGFPGAPCVGKSVLHCLKIN